MTSITSQNELANNAIGQNDRSMSCNQKQQWLAEWEKAFLQSQPESDQNLERQPDKKDAQVDSESRFTSLNTSNAFFVSNQVPMAGKTVLIQDDMQLTSAVVSSDVVNSAAAQRTNNISHTAVTARSQLSSNLLGTTARPIPNAKPNSMPQTAFESNPLSTFRISKQGQEVKVWMRENTAEGNVGQKIISGLRNVLSGLGLKLMSVTINGENIYQVTNRNTSGDVVSDEIDNILNKKFNNKLNKII